MKFPPSRTDIAKWKQLLQDYEERCMAQDASAIASHKAGRFGGDHLHGDLFGVEQDWSLGCLI